MQLWEDGHCRTRECLTRYDLLWENGHHRTPECLTRYDSLDLQGYMWLEVREIENSNKIGSQVCRPVCRSVWIVYCVDSLSQGSFRSRRAVWSESSLTWPDLPVRIFRIITIRSCFRKPYPPYFLGAYSKQFGTEKFGIITVRSKKWSLVSGNPTDPTFWGPPLKTFGTSENFSIFRLFWMIFMVFLFKKIFFAYLPTLKNIVTFFFVA